jgi:DNA-binding NarL/FixJ family response regulator
MRPNIRIILVDDHAVVRAGFRLLLAAEGNIDVIAECERGEAACQLYLDTKPDVLVLDLSMLGIGGLETIRRICDRDEAAKILVFSVHDEAVYVHRALNAGAKGYISKSTAPEILPQAIATLAEGGIYIEHGLLKQKQASAIDSLTPREFDVFLLLAKGLTAHKVAEELCLGYKTVANYSTQIKNKLNASTAAELAHIALVSGVLEGRND